MQKNCNNAIGMQSTNTPTTKPTDQEFDANSHKKAIKQISNLTGIKPFNDSNNYKQITKTPKLYHQQNIYKKSLFS